MGCGSSKARADKEIPVDDLVSLLQDDPHGEDALKLAKEKSEGVNKSSVQADTLEQIEKWFEESMKHEASSSFHNGTGFIKVELTDAPKKYKITLGSEGGNRSVERTLTEVEGLRKVLAQRFPKALVAPVMKSRSKEREAREQVELVQFFLRLTEANPWFRADPAWTTFCDSQSHFDVNALSQTKVEELDESETRNVEAAIQAGKSSRVWELYLAARKVPANGLSTLRSASDSIQTLRHTIKHVKEGAARLAHSHERYGHSWNNFAGVTDKWAATEGKNLPMMSTDQSSSSSADAYSSKDDTRTLTDALLQSSASQSKQSDIFGTRGGAACHTLTTGLDFEMTLLGALDEKVNNAEHDVLHLRKVHTAYREKISVVRKSAERPEDKGGKKLKALRDKVVESQRLAREKISSALFEVNHAAILRSGRLMAMLREFGLVNRGLYRECLTVWDDFEMKMGGTPPNDYSAAEDTGAGAGAGSGAGTGSGSGLGISSFTASSTKQEDTTNAGADASNPFESVTVDVDAETQVQGETQDEATKSAEPGETVDVEMDQSDEKADEQPTEQEEEEQPLTEEKDDDNAKETNEEQDADGAGDAVEDKDLSVPLDDDPGTNADAADTGGA